MIFELCCAVIEHCRYHLQAFLPGRRKKTVLIGIVFTKRMSNGEARRTCNTLYLLFLSLTKFLLLFLFFFLLLFFFFLLLYIALLGNSFVAMSSSCNTNRIKMKRKNIVYFNACWEWCSMWKRSHLAKSEFMRFLTNTCTFVVKIVFFRKRLLNVWTDTTMPAGNESFISSNGFVDNRWTIVFGFFGCPFRDSFTGGSTTCSWWNYGFRWVFLHPMGVPIRRMSLVVRENFQDFENCVELDEWVIH